ncbi:LacI family DNA-binding transcriptional regulator [Oscillibacter sp.]|uniref:LacI family DNA-binding transcriptional regulator n=1 Tax=Oscillibacter sp. TaxID=1945593 RepID=UPI00260C7D32|nr:LacI family DNA-binding transcriptional regulator [Oscillibacter sp.]MDD3347968.1 LacI family DNA-binding transcriptional regulator [Oscillibacter sp.]
MNSSEIAKLACVSRTTVSRVLNGHASVSEGTRERVEAVIREHNYFPDAAARNLVGKQNKVLGLFIMDVAATSDEYTISRSQFFYDYIAFAIDITNRHGYNLMTTIVHEDSMDDIDRLFQSRSISGGIIMGDHLDQNALARFSARGYKLVLYNQIRRSPASNIIVVNYDNFKCGRLAGEELVRQGHTKIAHVTGEPNKLSVRDRLEGFETALTAAGIPFDRARYLEYGAFNRRSGGYGATQRLLQRNRDDLPTALCAGSATMLMGTFEAIRDLGLRIPEDISLIGIDEVDTAIYTSPPLSVVSTCCEEIAKLTVVRLIELIEQGSVTPCDYVIPKVTLTLRSSISTCKSGSPGSKP